MKQETGKSDEGGARRRIIQALRLHGPQTAQELAKRLGGGSVAMRAHLRNLDAAGLVAPAEERQALGRPVRRFSLTPTADALFPKHYDLLAIKLLETIVSELDEQALQKVLSVWQDELQLYFDEKLPADPAARLETLAAHQTDYGFMAALEQTPAGTALVERNCPIARVAVRYPEICDHEAALYRRTLDREVTLRACQARGDATCVFGIGAIPRPTHKAG